MNLNLNPIELRDIAVDASTPAAVDAALRDLIERDWPTHKILAELPTIGESDVRRVRTALDRAAA